MSRFFQSDRERLSTELANAGSDPFTHFFRKAALADRYKGYSFRRIYHVCRSLFGKMAENHFERKIVRRG